MRIAIVCMFLVLAISMVYAQEEADGRSWFTTFTLIVATSTSTTTNTFKTTCTVSTTTLSTCTGGRRRRGLFYDESASNGKARRGLFYNDAEAEQADGSISKIKREVQEDEEKPNVARISVKSAVVGLEVQSGFALPDGLDNKRFGLAFGTTTTTTTTVTTSTSTLTATCASTSGFPTCGSGK